MERKWEEVRGKEIREEKRGEGRNKEWIECEQRMILREKLVDFGKESLKKIIEVNDWASDKNKKEKGKKEKS